MRVPGKYNKLFLQLSDSIESFIKELTKHNLNDRATEVWSVKDVICHIAFWHIYYAQNYASLAADLDPYVFTSKGGSVRNQKGVDSLKLYSETELIDLILVANDSLYESIVVKEVPKMSYTDRKEMKTGEFLIAITGHIKRHTSQVRRAKTNPE